MRYSTHLSLSLTFLSWVAVVHSQNCQLEVPANPLTAQGLATPYVLTGCNQLEFANQGAFVEAAILDPATGKIQIYNPLVINAGMTPLGNGTGATTSAGAATGAGTTTSTPALPDTASAGTTTASVTDVSGVPASTIASAEATVTNAARQAASAGFYVPPIVPTLPDKATVGIWFGSNAASVTLTGSTEGCVNGQGNSVFGQFAYCNGQAWFNAAKTAVSQGLINLPAPGTGSSGQVCPTSRDFRVVDQDQSDNVVTTYLLIGGNTLAQNTPDNNKANPGAQVLSNASDNALITQSIDPALGCAPYQNSCTTCPTGQSPALATDELVANFFPPAGGPALVPLNDPMALVGGQPSLQKVNLYRDGTGQPQADNNNASALTYCQQFVQSGIFINDNQQAFTNAGSPAAGAANSLFTFLAMRFSAAFGPAPGLGCTGLLNVANPVALTMDGNGVVTAATINTQPLQQILAGGTGGGAATAATTSSVPTSASTPASSTSADSNIANFARPTTTPCGAAADTTAADSITASQTGVLVKLASATNSVSSAAPTGAAGDSASGAAASGAQTSAAARDSAGGAATLGAPTSAASASGSTATTSAAGDSAGGGAASGAQTGTAAASGSAATTSADVSGGQVPPASSISTCTDAVTVTVTVTATACPAQTPALSAPSTPATTSAASASPTPCDDEEGGNDEGNGKRTYNGHHWKRSTPFTVDRMRRKSRIASLG